ncbi:MAG: LD-carboxypeptidase [Myxococcota bacterium]
MLPEGAQIAVVAPAGIFDPGRLAKSIQLVESWGYVFTPSPNLRATHRYTAGTVAERRDDFIWALTSPDVDAVWFARGGYGTVQLLDGLPFSEMDGRPVIGFSDATALFIAMEKLGVREAIHGPVLHSLADHVDDDSRQALKRLMQTGAEAFLSGRHLCGPRDTIVGRVIGGNLCMVASLAGTPWAMRANGAIVLLEDVNEPPYKLDRLITQLRQSGALDGVSAVALGEFTGSRAPEGAGWDIEDLMTELLEPLNVPVIAGLPVGHGQRNHAWKYGAAGVLTEDGLLVG